MPPLAQALFRAAGAVAAIGIALAVAVPLLGLRSDACGPVGCAEAQVVGKTLAAGGVALALGAVAVVCLLGRRFSAGTLALAIALPALIWAVLVVDGYRQQQAGLDDATRVIAIARDYAAAQPGAGEPLQATVFNGRGDWLSVRMTRPDGSTFFVLQQRSGGVWSARAAAPTFTREELRALGAPTDLLRDPR
jgi:hypothetical protein